MSHSYITWKPFLLHRHLKLNLHGLPWKLVWNVSLSSCSLLSLDHISHAKQLLSGERPLHPRKDLADLVWSSIYHGHKLIWYSVCFQYIYLSSEIYRFFQGTSPPTIVSFVSPILSEHQWLSRSLFSVFSPSLFLPLRLTPPTSFH